MSTCFSDHTAPAALKRVVARYAAVKNVHEVIVGAYDGMSDTTIAATSGNWQGRPIDADTPFFIASTSKLFATAMIMRLQAAGRLSLDDPILRYFGTDEIGGLHRLADQDHTKHIRLRHLLAHTSGLPDYFEGRRRDGSRLVDQLLAGRDLGYDLRDVIGWSRDEMRAHFPPGHGRRALYSDTNFFLLGEVIARVHGGSLPDALDAFITRPLGLTRTQFYAQGVDAMPMRNGANELHIPQAMASMPVDGGIVSTLADMMRFTRAFFAGEMFPAADLSEMADWRRIFFPLEAGVGLLRFRLPRWLSPFSCPPALIGHSGISGAFAFHVPERNVTICGTLNQIANRSRPYRLMLEALNAARLDRA